MNKKILFYLSGVVVVAAVLFLLWFLGQQSTENRLQVVVPNAPPPDVVAVTEREVTLYFASENATQLVSTAGRIGCNDDLDCLRQTVEALIRGPQTDALPVIPTAARLLNLRVEEDLAILDFDAAFVDGHPGGSQGELLTVYALANSIAVNFPHLRQIQILINGEKVDTLKGHVDLRRPLLADFTYTRRILEAVDVKE
jgi:spore germination protein GerM